MVLGMTLNCLYYELNSELTMQFRLPSQLQQELLAYDPQLKALSRQQTAKTTRKKSSHSLGQPENLIPTDVVRVSLYNDAVDNINSCAAEYRFHAFKRVKNVATPDASVDVFAVLYHYEQCWYAAWLPPKGKEDDYIYGYSFAFKDTATALKIIPSSIKHNIAEYQQVKWGKSTYYTYQKLVTKQDIIDGLTQKKWNIPGAANYYKKSGKLSIVLLQFEEQLRKSIPLWKDSNNIFDRLRATNPIEVINNKASYYSLRHENYWKDHDIKTAQVSYELVFNLITYYAHNPEYYGDIFKESNKILHIISTPFFKRWIQGKCDEINSKFNDPDNELMIDIVRPWNQITTLLKKIIWIHSVWPDCPLDYYQKNIDQLLAVVWNRQGCADTHAWLNQHMPVASFFHIVNKFYEQSMEEVNVHKATYESLGYRVNSDLGIVTFTFYNWSDTIQMLDVVLAHNKCATEPVELLPPKRWRLDDFHDYIQAESWKIKHRNESLPQDLFPVPVKVTVGSINWTFFQPVDTHHLAQWGQAARNCVGSATGYAEGVRKKKHFIVLCMLDGKPQFTIQLDVSMGVMNVKQIAGIANAKLTLEQRELYQTAFAEALKQRENQLVSA